MASPLGVLILHGFTSGRATVAGVGPRADALGLPWRLPQLRGHWTRAEDLVGVTYADMLADARAALAELRGEVERVIVVGLSVGGVLALNLAIEHPGEVESLVVLAPALRYANPLTNVAALVARFVKTMPLDTANAFTDRTLAAGAGNYTSFPTQTFVTIVQAGRQIEGLLPRVGAPLLAIGARRDRVVQPHCAQLVYQRAGSREKEIAWFERSGHELLLDCEGDAVLDRVGEFLRARVQARSVAV